VPDSCQEATASVNPHPTGATSSATVSLSNDPDLAAIIDAWPALPEAVQAGILAMVKAAAGSGMPGS
jgi:hypothetical protein